MNIISYGGKDDNSHYSTFIHGIIKLSVICYCVLGQKLTYCAFKSTEWQVLHSQKQHKA